MEFYAAAFRKATGVSLRVVAPADTGNCPSFNAENPFCALAASSPLGCVECKKAETRARFRVAQKLSPQQLACYAGLTVLAVPILAGGHHVATLMSGQVFRRAVATQLGRRGARNR